MAVTRAEKEQELQDLASAFGSVDTAILVDYKGLNVPQVTELRRQLRSAKATYKVVKNTLAKRALKGTSFEALDAHFQGTTAVVPSNCASRLSKDVPLIARFASVFFTTLHCARAPRS